ncbi:MAG: TauD/TfdA family dioxygenase [Deltaproteobacteria bacterium]|nr:TauD/TfdA family dioxygenase [Deltaproteobacteria bacterium]
MNDSTGCLGVVAREGFAFVSLARDWATTPEGLRDAAASGPYAFATRLLGIEPLLVERQPIRPVDGGRSFASTRIDTPLHTDSQSFLGMSPAIQILVCIAPAPRGGESTLVDGARLLGRLERESPGLASALFDVDRTQRFYFGEVRGPTVALRGGHLAWTVAPPTSSLRDEVGASLAAELARETPLVRALGAGEALVASNHRMLHGRTPFDGARELVRLLVWLAEPLPADPRHVARAKVVTPPVPAEVAARLRAVLAIVRGVPPAKVAADARVDEATLYAWRDAFMLGGAPALSRA